MYNDKNTYILNYKNYKSESQRNYSRKGNCLFSGKFHGHYSRNGFGNKESLKKIQECLKIYFYNF